MTRVADAMTTGARSVAAHDTVLRAAELMRAIDVGVLPVCAGGKIIGMVTDRDIVTRGVARGRLAQTTEVSEVMSDQVRWCFEDQDVDEVLAEMRESQVHQMAVVDRQRNLVGMLSIGDIAVKTRDTASAAARTLRRISEPAQPDRSGRAVSDTHPS